MSNTYIIIQYLIFYVLGFFLGKMTRRNIIFGVTIHSEDVKRNEVMQLKKMYLYLYGGVMTILSAIFITLDMLNFNIMNMMFFVIVWLVVSSVIYLQMNRRMKAYKALWYQDTQRKKTRVTTASLERRDEELPNVSVYFIVPALLVILTFIITYLNYDNVPERIPMNFNGAGEVTNWASKSVLTVYMMVFVQLFMQVLIYAVTVASVKFSRRDLNPKKPETSRVQYQIAMKRFGMMMAGTLILINGIMFYIQLMILELISPEARTVMYVNLGMLIMIFALLILFFATTGMTGDRVKVDFDEEELDVEEADDDTHWVGGLFYFNKNDSSIFVPKRFGGGFTMNFANPIAYVLLAVILAIVVGSLLLGR